MNIMKFMNIMKTSTKTTNIARSMRVNGGRGRSCRRWPAWACVAAMLIVAATAGAQVHQVTGGRALDASYQVGSGGVNTAVPSNYAPASTSIYSGTATRGLSGFRGSAPSLSGDFSGRLGSDSLSRFERQSVGVGDVLRGGAYDPQRTVYYDPYRRTLSPQSVSRAAEYGVTPIPGEVSRSSRIAQKLYVDATVDYAPVMADLPQNIQPGQLLDVAEPRGGRVDDLGRASPRLDAMDRATREGPGMFGVLKSDDRAKLADELQRLREQRMGEQEDENDRREKPIDALVQPEGSELAARPLGEALRGPVQAEPLRIPGQDEDDADELARRGMIVNRRPGDENLPAADEDVFLDVLVALRQSQIRGEGEGLDGDTTLPELERGQPGQPMTGRRVERTDDNRVVIHRLEGKTPSNFNDFMRQGRQALKQGRFYRAARQYELASMVRPHNPLPLVGEGLSAFASGEYYTSAMSFRRALEVFPALMETQLDLKSLLPVTGFDMDQQMHKLEQWLAEIEAQPPVRFLATFLYQNLGKAELARHHAESLVEADRQIDPIFRAYGQYVLTGKKPSELIEAAPTPTR